jgi:AcrR family transcriptional regulator
MVAPQETPMPRPLGRRNPDYDEKRDRLLYDLCDFVLRTQLTRPSFRQLAQAGGVAEPTLRHYFGDRDSVASEILAILGERAAPFIEAVSQPPTDQNDAVEAYIELSRAGVTNGGFARAHCFGLVEGVADEKVGRAYLTELLEPSLAALEHRLRPHLGDKPSPERQRAAALMLFAPLLLSVIHQQLLGGTEAAPMDLDRVFDELAQLSRAAIAGSTA